MSGSDATATGQTLVDVTGLTFNAAPSSTYEFETLLDVSTTAVTKTGTKYGVNVSPAPTRIFSTFVGPTTSPASVRTMVTGGANADDIASATFLTTASETGLLFKGYFVTSASASPDFSIRHLKVTSGTSTVKIGSILKVRKIDVMGDGALERDRRTSPLLVLGAAVVFAATLVGWLLVNHGRGKQPAWRRALRWSPLRSSRAQPPRSDVRSTGPGRATTRPAS